MTPFHLLLLALAVLTASRYSRGNDIAFDCRTAFACRTLPTNSVESDTKLVEAIIKISADFGDTKESEVEYIRYEMRLPDGIKVEDHLPKTELNHDILATE